MKVRELKTGTKDYYGSTRFCCHNCKWGTDKCKNPKSINKDSFKEDIEFCDIVNRKIDNYTGYICQ